MFSVIDLHCTVGVSNLRVTQIVVRGHVSFILLPCVGGGVSDGRGRAEMFLLRFPRQTPMPGVMSSGAFDP